MKCLLETGITVQEVNNTISQYNTRATSKKGTQMITKGIRGATTVESNSVQDLQKATLELLNEMIIKNNIDKNNISHVIFTTTPDINAAFPAKFARIDLGWEEVAMMCFNEIDVPNALPMCLRILIVLNCEENFKPQFVYLNATSNLRK